MAKTHIAIAIGLVVAVSITTPLFAQGMGGGKKHHSEQKTGTPKKKTDDKGYKDALGKIPAQKADDPWRGVR